MACVNSSHNNSNNNAGGNHASNSNGKNNSSKSGLLKSRQETFQVNHRHFPFSSRELCGLEREDEEEEERWI